MGTNYVLGRLRCDSRHVCDLALHEGQVGHAGVKGRFRELLLNNLLVPWLPASMGCGTGVIIDCKQERNSQYLWMGSRRPSFDPAL